MAAAVINLCTAIGAGLKCGFPERFAQPAFSDIIEGWYLLSVIQIRFLMVRVVFGNSLKPVIKRPVADHVGNDRKCGLAGCVAACDENKPGEANGEHSGATNSSFDRPHKFPFLRRE